MKLILKEDLQDDVIKNGTYRVMLVNDMKGGSNKLFTHNVASSGIKSYESKYREKLVSKPLGKGLVLVSHLLLLSGIPTLCELAYDIQKQGKLTHI